MSSLPRNPSLDAEKAEEEKRFEYRLQNFPPLKRITETARFVHTAAVVEVFQVRIDKFDEMERRGELYGSIDIHDLSGPLPLYHRDRGNSEHIRANCSISLTGPPYSCIPQIIGFAVQIDLQICGENESLDVALGKWTLSWDALKPEVAYITRGKFLMDFCVEPNLLLSEAKCRYQAAGYDQPLSAVFEGTNGSCITMYYAIHQHAVQAWVQVEVIDVNSMPGTAEYNVRGSMFATYGHFEIGNDSDIKEHCKSTLLETRDLESVKVTRWRNIDLSRCVVAVPAYSSLIVEADLWDTSGLKIAKGKLEFTPYHQGYGVDYIKGDDDVAIRVIVTWSFAWDYIPSSSPI